MRRVYIETYGCQMNVADTELMLGVLGRDGFVHLERTTGAIGHGEYYRLRSAAREPA